MAESRGSRRVLVATNKHLRALPPELHDDALCELARELSRQVDAGHTAAATQLIKVLEQLRKLAAPPKASAKAAEPEPSPEEEPGPDELDEVARMRADRLAGASGVVRSLRGDHRRA